MLFDWEIGVKVKLVTASKWPRTKGLDKGHCSLGPFIVATLSGYLGLLLFICPLNVFFFRGYHYLGIFSSIFLKNYKNKNDGLKESLGHKK